MHHMLHYSGTPPPHEKGKSALPRRGRALLARPREEDPPRRRRAQPPPRCTLAAHGDNAPCDRAHLRGGDGGPRLAPHPRHRLLCLLLRRAPAARAWWRRRLLFHRPFFLRVFRRDKYTLRVAAGGGTHCLFARGEGPSSRHKEQVSKDKSALHRRCSRDARPPLGSRGGATARPSALRGRRGGLTKDVATRLRHK